MTTGKSLSCVLLALISLCARAQQQKMTLEQCRATALEHNRAIAVASLTFEKTAHDAKAFKANYFPKFSLSGSYLYSHTEMNKTLAGNYLPTFVPDLATGELTPNLLTLPDGTPVYNTDGTPVFKEYAYFPDMDISLKLNGSYMVGIRAEQPVYMGGKIRSARKMSLIGNEIAGLNRQLTRAEIIVMTDEAYWTFVKTVEMVKLAEVYRKVVTELLRNVQDAFDEGLKPRNDVLKVQVKVNEAELQLRKAENGVRLSRMNLCRIMGISLVTPVVAADSLEFSSAVGIDRAAGHTERPEYAILLKKNELKQEEISLIRSDFLPQAGIMANYGYVYGLKLNGSPLLNKLSLSAVVSVEVPLFHWGEGRNKIRSAEAERKIMEIQLDDAGEQMKLDLMQAINKCDEAALETELMRKSFEQAEENMKVSRDQYEAGMETLAGYLEAQTVWQQACVNLINAGTSQRYHETYYLKAAGKL
ncbi:MAG: TolC family protein [Bacteroidales bacterium]|jgi:outer membrane protein TolC|nr:TolC family protein [Bacteroidales bacterium]